MCVLLCPNGPTRVLLRCRPPRATGATPDTQLETLRLEAAGFISVEAHSALGPPVVPSCPFLVGRVPLLK